MGIMKKKWVAISQSNYIPWKGYFDIINSVDEFVLYDDAQFTKRDWRNRNQIKTPQGLQWLTISVESKGRFFQSIRETKIADPNWKNLHWQTLRHFYAKAAHFEKYEDTFSKLYSSATDTYLSEVNRKFLEKICTLLGIKTKISGSHDYVWGGENSTEKLLSLTQAVGGTHYLSGPRAADYMNLSLFEKAQIPVQFYDYNNYPEYAQLYPPFSHSVSILDLLFNEGDRAPLFMKSFDNTVDFNKKKVG